MHSTFHILLVDDSPSDVLIIERALREGNINHRLTILRDSRTALDYLLALKEPDSPADLEPDLVLLDLNLPGLDGCHVVAAIKGDPELRSIPVVILTTSCLEDDVRRASLAGANTFIRKPDEYPRYQELVAILHQYWHQTAIRLPRR